MRGPVPETKLAARPRSLLRDRPRLDLLVLLQGLAEAVVGLLLRHRLGAARALAVLIVDEALAAPLSLVIGAVDRSLNGRRLGGLRRGVLRLALDGGDLRLTAPRLGPNLSGHRASNSHSLRARWTPQRSTIMCLAIDVMVLFSRCGIAVQDSTRHGMSPNPSRAADREAGSQMHREM